MSVAHRLNDVAARIIENADKVVEDGVETANHTSDLVPSFLDSCIPGEGQDKLSKSLGEVTI